jgi:hypothetical protein
MDSSSPNCSSRSSVALRSAWALAALFLFALTGCATPTPPGGKFEPGESPPTTFGRLVATYNGDPQKLGGIGFWGKYQCYGLVLSKSQNRGLVLGFTEDGWFSWPLDPGHYVFTDLWCEWGGGWGSGTEYTLPVNWGFQVAQGTGTTYIGHFSLNYADAFHAHHGFQPIAWEMNAQEAAAEFARRYPNAPAASPQRPVLDPGPGKVAGMSDICAPEWHVDCDTQFGMKFRGVEAVEPALKGTRHGLEFGTVDSLTPVLKWKAAGGTGVRYDVAVWEVVTYRVPNSKVNARGRLVAYAENLDAPQYAIVDPLKAKTLYYWSVRLRDGDGVSTWSRAHALALGLHWGLWFGFETP